MFAMICDVRLELMLHLMHSLSALALSLMRPQYSTCLSVHSLYNVLCTVHIPSTYIVSGRTHLHNLSSFVKLFAVVSYV